MAPGNDPGAGGPVHRVLRFAFQWARPSWTTAPALDETVWRAQHDEISKIIWRLASLLTGACVFCLIILGAPDVSLVSTDAKISVPLASITVSYGDFLVFAPLFLIALTLYLHVFIEHRLRLGTRFPPDAGRPPRGQPLTPFLFNLGRPSAELLSAFLFYGMSPAVLAYFVWKTIPRRDAPWLLLFAFFALAVLMIGLRIRRFDAEALWARRVLPGRVGLGALWILFVACLVALLSVVPITWQVISGPAARSRAAAGPSLPASGGTWRESALLKIRTLQLFAAQLEKKNLSGLYAPYADLRKANFQETDLEEANLSHADLRNANLTDANLRGADLTFARLEGANLTGARLERANLRDTTMDDATQIASKWRLVACIVSTSQRPACLGRTDLTWADLSGADLRGANLANTDLTAANLRGADLSDATLGGARLRMADLRNAILPASFADADTFGVRTSATTADPAAAKGVDVFLMNRTSEACVESPQVPDDYARPTMAYPCSDSPPRQRWHVKRLPSGLFVFTASVSGSDKQSACLDGTAFNAERAPIQMWQCNDDYDTQQWRLEPTFGDFLWIAKNTTGMCLHGTGTREGTPTPFLSACDLRNHDQHWRLLFSAPDVSKQERDRLARNRARQERQADLERVAREYQVGVSGSDYWSAVSGPSDFYRRRLSPSARPTP